MCKRPSIVDIMFNAPKIWNHLFILAILFAIKPAIASQQDYPFKLISRADAGSQIILAQNSGPAPILATVSLLNPVNAIIDRSSPIAVVVPPGETITVAVIHGAVQGQEYRIATNYKFSIGNPDAVQDPRATYLLPFKEGQVITVGQVLGGKITTHNNPASRNAVDFTVPIGTPILLARKGRVVDIDQGYSEGGADPLLKANHVLILHEDGTLGLYSHFAHNRIMVSSGQWLEAGALIGYSGNTGYSTGPHLHFVVLSNTRSTDGAAQYLSQPVKFVNYAPLQEVQLCQGDKLVPSHHDAQPKTASVDAGQQRKASQPCPMPSPVMP